MRRALPALLLLALAAGPQSSDPVSPFRDGERWVWLRLDRSAFRVEPVAGEAYWTVRALAPPGTAGIDARTILLLPGSGLELVTPFEGQAVRFQVDTLYVAHLAGAGAENEPADGEDCFNGFGFWLGAEAMHVCAPPDGNSLATAQGWKWKSVPWAR